MTRNAARGLFLLGWASGLLLAFYPVLLSGFAHIPGDHGDARLINYLLEHSWRWLRREPLHRQLWDLPIFHPTANTGAFSDILVSAGPLYWPWRAVGIAPETAFQLWMLAVASLNYLLAYLLLRRLKYEPLASVAGAFLFTFASPRLLHIVHLQLHVHCFTIGCVYALVRLFEPEEIARPALRGWALLGAGCFVAQFYASFYLGWFLALQLLIAGVCALAMRAGRARLFVLVRRIPFTLLALTAAMALPLLDMARHYLQTVRDIGWQEPELIEWGIPSLTAWWSRGEESWFNLSNTLAALGVPALDWPQGEHALGLGPITTVVVVLGLWRQRREPVVRLLIVVSLVWIVAITAVSPPGDRPLSLWRWLYPYVPAAAAIRAVGRVVLLLLLPAAVGLAGFVATSRRTWLTACLLALCALEQGRTLPWYDKAEAQRDVAELALHLPPGETRPFFYVAVVPAGVSVSWYKPQIDAMWLELATGLPTVNGYSGKFPPGWRLIDNQVREGESLDMLREELKAWLRQHNAAEGDVLFLPVRFERR